MGESSSEVCVSVSWVMFDDYIEIFYSFFVHMDHLISFRSLVNISQVTRYTFDTFSIWEDRLLELFLTAVGEANVIENIRFMVWMGSSSYFIFESCF